MTRALRVAYLTRYLPAPSETFVLDEALALEEHGAEVLPFVLDRVGGAVRHARHEEMYARTRIVPRPSSPRAFIAAATLEEQPAFIAVRAAWATAGRRRDLRRVAWLARAWRRAAVDVVRVHFASESARYAVAAAAMAGVPVSVAVHARDLFVPVEDFAWIVRSCAHVTTITPYHRDRLLRSGLTSERVALLRCPVHLPAEVAQGPEPGCPLRLLSVGRLVRKKGHDLLLEAAAELASEGTPIELTIVGDGPEGLVLRSRAARLEQQTRALLSVDLVGAQPIEVVERLLASGQYHAAVLACRVAADGDRDGVPVSLMEARAYGLPVVTSALEGFDFELTPETGAVLVPLIPTEDGAREPSRPQLVRELAELYRDPDRRASLGRAARAAAERRTSPAAIGAELLEMLLRLRMDRSNIAPPKAESSS